MTFRYISCRGCFPASPPGEVVGGQWVAALSVWSPSGGGWALGVLDYGALISVCCWGLSLQVLMLHDWAAPGSGAHPVLHGWAPAMLLPQTFSREVMTPTHIGVLYPYHPLRPSDKPPLTCIPTPRSSPACMFTHTHR